MMYGEAYVFSVPCVPKRITDIFSYNVSNYCPNFIFLHKHYLEIRQVNRLVNINNNRQQLNFWKISANPDHTYNCTFY